MSGHIPVIFTRAQIPIANESEMRQISNYALIFGLDYAMWEILDALLDTALTNPRATVRLMDGLLMQYLMTYDE